MQFDGTSIMATGASRRSASRRAREVEMHLNDPSVYLRYARLHGDGRSGMRGLPDALSSQGRRGISCRKEQWARGNGRVLLCSLLSRSDAHQAHVEGVMQANACYLCSRPSGLIRHRHGSKQFCSKKCLHEWRAGLARVLQESTRQQERQRRFWDWLARPG
jgi:hypothetical protein